LHDIWLTTLIGFSKEILFMPKLNAIYLDSTKVKTVTLDHDALKLSQIDQSPRWFPLNRISRITVFGEMTWNTFALMACMERCIPITFTEQNGKMKGLCLGIDTKPSRFGDSLIKLLTHIGGDEKLNDWFDAIQRQYKVNSLSRLNIQVEDYKSTYILDIFSAYIRDIYKINDSESLFHQLESLLFTHISAFLAQNLTIYRASWFKSFCFCFIIISKTG